MILTLHMESMMSDGPLGSTNMEMKTSLSPNRTESQRGLPGDLVVLPSPSSSLPSSVSLRGTEPSEVHAAPSVSGNVPIPDVEEH